MAIKATFLRSATDLIVSFPDYTRGSSVEVDVNGRTSFLPKAFIKGLPKAKGRDVQAAKLRLSKAAGGEKIKVV